MVTIGSVIKTKERQNVSAGQQIVEGLLKNLNPKTKKGLKSKITIGSVMIMTKKITKFTCGTVNCKGFIERV